MVRLKPKRPSLDGVLVALVALLIVIGSCQSYYLVTTVSEQQREQQYIQCQVRVNTEFRGAITERTVAATAERAAQKTFLTTLEWPSTADVRAAAYKTYFDALDAADAARANTPLPDDNC